MAKHRIPKKHRARKTLLATAAAAGVSSSLVLGLATNTTAENLATRLAANDTVIAAGGLFDTTGERVQTKLQGALIPADFDYRGVPYPATTNLSGSRDAGVVTMDDLIRNSPLATAPHLLVASYSEGTLVAEQERRNLQAVTTGAPSPSQLSFLQLASPFAGNGGIYARFPGISIPGITDAMGAGQPTRYDTTYMALMYDSYADFPAYFNPLALLNTALSIRYGHPDTAYDPIDAATTPSYVTTVPHQAEGSTDTYVLIYSPHLPLFGPVRELASLVGISALVEPVLGAIEPLVRLMVDMGYTDRVNANPAAVTPFSLLTPPEKFLQAIAGIPGALAEGLNNLVNGGQAPLNLPDPIGNLQPSVPLPTGTPDVAPQVQNGQARLALVPTVQQDPPKQKLDEAPPTSTELGDETETTPTSTGPTASPAGTTSVDDVSHPTVTSNGNKFTPGTDGAAAQSTTASGSQTVGATTSSNSLTTATTTTATTPPVTTTSGTGASPSVADTKSLDTKDPDTKDPDTKDPDTKGTDTKGTDTGSGSAAAA